MLTSKFSKALAMVFLVPLLATGANLHHDSAQPATLRRSSTEGGASVSPALVRASPVIVPDPTVVEDNRAVVTSTPSTTAVAAVAAQSDPIFVVRARRGGPVVRATPNENGKPLSGLYFDTYLPVYAQQKDGSGTLWYQIRLWGALPGWIRADQTETGDPPPPTPSPSSPPANVSRPGRSDVFPLSARGITSDWVNLRTGSSVDSGQLDLIAPGIPVTVQAWQTDDEASAWYRVVVKGESGWIWSGGVDLSTPTPSKVTLAGKPIWSAITGKGMWMPIPLLDMASPDAVVAAARDLGLTHIYLEVGASGGGFYGREDVDRLLPVAHQAGIKVVGWVLTGLNNLPSDVALCTSIATYRTPSGDQLDGIAPDIEDNMDATDVAAFSQILRARVGVDHLIVGVIFPAGTWIGQRHPVAGILAHSFNALAPMDYWHDSQGTFDAETIDTFIRRSVVDIQKAVGDSSYPVAVIGQTYDAFSRNGAGPNNPTGAEIRAALEAARAGGAVGVSLFQWGTTTPSEWDVLHAFQWPHR